MYGRVFIERMSGQPMEDYLDSDAAIPGQNYACISFISPNNLIERKTLYRVHEFLKNRCEKYDLKFENLEEEFRGFELTDGDRMDKAFDEMVDFKTTVRGLKIRGVYDTLKEAQNRAQSIRRKDPLFDVYIGQVGFWLPWDPEMKDREKIQDQEYMEKELNTLMKSYRDNQKMKDEFWAQEKEDRVKAVKAQNERVAAENRASITEIPEAANASSVVSSASSVDSTAIVSESSGSSNDVYGIESNVERIKNVQI